MFRVQHQWTAAVLIAAAVGLSAGHAEAGEVRDKAGIFSVSAVKTAVAKLDQVEKKTGIPVVIETIDAVPGLDRGAPTKERKRAVEQLAERRAKEIGYEGVYLLISKQDRVFSNVLVRDHYASALPQAQREAVLGALKDEFKAGRFDEGLLKSVETLDQRLLTKAEAGRPHAAPVPGGRRPAVMRDGRSGVGTLLMIGLGIFGVLLVLRLLGGLFNRGQQGFPGQAGMGGDPRLGMGPGPGQGPGYGPGYGYGAPRGGGFFSGMLGGLGGALAGNWLYDQFSGRHGGMSQTEAGSYSPGESTGTSDGGGEFVGGDDNGGMGGSWGEPGGADAGGGDWGGGDGGADWGGGGDGGGDW